MIGDNAGERTTILSGRYRLDRVLGEGTFGRVYIAHDGRLQRTVAIKELLATNTTTDPQEFQRHVERFQREARAAGSVFHANIVNVFELAIDTDNNYYLIMEYVERGNLRDLLRQVKTLPVGRAVGIALDIARALEAIHEVDIVHRDLKPANIMLTSRGVAKLTDFGVAQLSHESQRTQLSVGHPGTPLYMSPEQRQNTDYLDGRSDLYSLGLVLYEMLAGEPYGRRKQPLDAVRPDLDPDLVRIFTRLTERDLLRRYQSADAVIADLAAILARESRGSGTHGTHPPPAAETVLDDRFPSHETVIDPPASSSSGRQSSGPPFASGTGAPLSSGTGSTGAGTGAVSASSRSGAPIPPALPEPRKRSRLPLLIASVAGVVALLAAVGAVVFVRGGALNGGPATATPQGAGGATQSAALAASVTPAAPPTPTASATPSPTATMAATATPTAAPATNTPTPSPTTRPVATVRPDFQGVTNQKFGIAFAYPKAWQRSDDETDQDTIHAFRISPSAAFLVAKEDNPTAATLNAYIEDEIKTVIAQHPGWKVGTRARQTTMLGGQPALIADFLVPTTTGQGYHYYVFTLRPKQAWGLLFFMPIDDFTKYQKDIDDVVRSFAFCADACPAQSASAPSIPAASAENVRLLLIGTLPRRRQR